MSDQITKIRKFHQLCQEVIQAAKDYPKNTFIQYASNYAKQGLRAEKDDEIETAALYILSNLKYWRGILATDTKRKLKEFTH